MYDIDYLEYDVEQNRNYESIPTCLKNCVELEGTCFFISNYIQKTEVEWKGWYCDEDNWRTE